jgi:bacteriocin leader peptide (microcyclamide/patellamide family)
MDNFNFMPQPAQPVNRITTGQLPAVLAELREEALTGLRDSDDSSSSAVLPSLGSFKDNYGHCSYDGDDAE